MNSLGLSPKSAAARLLVAAGTLTALAPAADAATPKHKYTFNNGNANDSSINAAHGTVIDNTGISKYTGGALDLTANNNANSAQDFSVATTVGAYVDLPNGIFTSAVSSGTFGAVTLEVWATPQENRNWARLVDFGTSNGGENVSGSGSTSSYVIMVPQSDRAGQAIASAHSAAGIENFAEAGAALPVGTRSHMVAVFDQNDSTAGLNGTLTLYVNNGTPKTAAIPDGLFLDSITDNNNWLGRAQWGDPLFDGLIDEFRIYDTALTAADVAANFAAGPDPAPVPTLTVDRSTGVISLTNQSGGPLNVTGYSITSGGGLKPASWTSIDAGRSTSTTTAVVGDFNDDGLVNAADWAIFVPNSFTTFAADPAVTAYMKGDLDGDKDNDFADFKLFKADFIAANGAAAFAALGAAVPEPATIALGGLASLALVAARRRVARN